MWFLIISVIVTPYTNIYLGKIDLSNGFLSADTKPLPEPMLTSNYWALKSWFNDYGHISQVTMSSSILAILKNH